MTGSRLRLVLVLAGLALGGLVLLTWTQGWIVVDLVDGTRIVVSGQQAAPALSALGLAVLPPSGALTISGRMFRIVLGVVEAVFGIPVISTAVLVLADPVPAASATITGLTAVAGPESITAIIGAASVTSAPVLAAIVGALLIALGAAVALTAHRWPGPSRKYDVDRDRTDTVTDAWEALSDGDDPTSR